MWYIYILALNKSFNKSCVKFVLLITKSVFVLYKRNDEFNKLTITIVKRKYTYRAIIS